MTKWLTLILVALIGYNVLSSHVDAQGSGTINQLSPFQVSGGVVRLASTTAGFRIPSLQSITCLGTDSNGNLQLGTCTGGGGGGTDTLFNWNTGTNIISTDGVSTTATTSFSTNGITANNATITNATSTTGWFSSIVRALNSVFTNATTTNLRTTQLGVGSDYITDLTGTGLSIVGNALTATNDHVAVTVSGARDYITLSGQDIVRGVVDVSDDTNLSGDTEVVLTGDALSLGESLTFTSATATNLASTLSTTSVFYGAGLTDCDTAGTSKLLWDVTTGKFSCGTDQDSGGSGGTDVNWSFTAGNSFISPATTTNGIIVRASSTIGDGTGAGGLTIAGTATTTGNVYVKNGDLGSNIILDSTSINPAASSSIRFYEGGTLSMSYGYDGSGTGDANRLNIFDLANNIERFTYTRGGSFGISSSSPSRKLTIAGGDIWLGGNLFATGTASSTYASTSDITIYQALYDTNSQPGSNNQVLTSTGTSTLWRTISVAGDGVSNWSYDGVRLTPSSSPSIGILSTGSSTLSNLNFTNATGTNATTTNLRTTQLGVGSDYLTDITGTGLQITGNALTLNTTGDWTGTLDGFEGATLAQTNWSYDGTRLTPTTSTAGILANGSSTLSLFNFTSATGTNATTTNLFATLGRFTNASTSYASTTGLSVSSGISLFGNTSVYTANALCVLLTGGSDLCDGSDATGGGSSATGTTLVCASGCPYSNIQTALDAGVRNIQLKEETYAGPVQIKNSFTKITGSGSTATITCDGTTLAQPCLSIATTSRLGSNIVRDVAVYNTNASMVGTGIDFSDASEGDYSNLRSIGFNIGILHQDTTNSAFYSRYEKLDIYASSSCFKTGGTKSNDNSIDTARCIVVAPTGIGYNFIDSEGWILNNINAEPGSLIGTGLYVDATSIGITVINPWFEGNATNTEIRAGALNTSIKGGRITAGTVGVYDGGTNTFIDSALISANTTNITCPTNCLGTYVNASSQFLSPFVGIGTTTQSSTFNRLGLSISTSDPFANMAVYNNAGAFATAPSGLLFTHSSGGFATGTARIYANPGSGYTNSSLTFSVADSAKALQDRLTIDVQGDVGIGSTSPGYLFTLQGGNSFFGGNLWATGTASSTFASTSALTVHNNAYLNTFTSNSGTTTNIASSLSTTSVFYGAGLTDCDVAGSSKVLWDVTTGKFSCGTDQTGGGGGSSNWIRNAALDAITPSSTVGIVVNASSSIGGGTGLSGLTINGGATTTLSALFSQNINVLGTASSTYASTSDLTIYQSLYDTRSSPGTSGQVLTSTGTSTIWATVTGGSGSPSGSTGDFQWNNGGSFGGATPLTYNSTLGRIGISSSTPSSIFAIASSTFNYLTPLLRVATSGPSIFSINSTTTDLFAGLAPTARNGVVPRVLIGENYFGTPGLDALNVSGRTRSDSWIGFNFDYCVAASLASDGGGTICPQLWFNEDTAATLDPVYANGYAYSRLTTSAGNDGGSVLWLTQSNAATTWMRLASSTPSFEITARPGTIPAAGTSTNFYIGYTNTGVNSATLEAVPTVGCFFMASSTGIGGASGYPNWLATCKRSDTSTTTIDTGVPSTTVAAGQGAFRRFRIDADGDVARFWIATGNGAYTNVATISSNVPSTTALYPSIIVGRQTGTAAAGIEFMDSNLWIRRLIPTL